MIRQAFGTRRAAFAAGLVGLALAAGTGRAGLPDPKTGGAGGGPLSILFLGKSPKLDAAYARRLSDQGYAFALAPIMEPIKPEFFRKFNVFVVDATEQAGGQYEVFGQDMIHYWANMSNLWAAIEAGAGALVYPNLNDCGGSLALGWNQDMKRFGIRVCQASAIDLSRAIYGWNAYGTNVYCWTENIAAHPATEGVKRIYYAGGNARWDDCYLTPPFVLGPDWTALVKGMPESRAANQIRHEWVADESCKGEPVLAAVRPLGKGRLAVFGLSPNYVHRYGLTKIEDNSLGEQSVGVIDGIILEKGDGAVPSDTGRFVEQLYRWLAGESAAAGLGGYKAGEPVEKAEVARIADEMACNPVLDIEHMEMPPSWKHRPTRVRRSDGSADFPEMADPIVPGPVRFFKGLIGAHSVHSDGKGTVAEYAAAARAAGYSLVAFTENFEHLSPESFERLAADCEANTTEDLVCLPGFDIMDPWGNHFLVIAPPYYPRAGWLTEDGKRLAMPPYINLNYGNHIVVAHLSAKGNIPVERLKHFQGFSVFTYRCGKLIEDATDGYAWLAESGSMPHPVAVHEVFAPGEVAAAARTGYQQILPSDTPANAAGYFRIGLAHFFEGPSRYLLSEGPLVTTWIGLPKDAGPAAENKDLMRVDIALTNDAPLASVELRDGRATVRRWLPGSNSFAVSTFFRHTQQRALYVAARDAQGRGVLTSVLRTVPARCHFRCSDRQNWLGHVAAWYPGMHLQYDLDINMPVAGTAEGSGIFNNTPGACMAAKLNYPFSCPDAVVLDAVLDEKYVAARRGDVGADARPSYPSEPSTVYSGTVRTVNFTAGKRRRCVVRCDVDIVLKRDVEPAKPGGLFPAVSGVRSDFVAWLKDGQVFTNTLKGMGAAFDVPANGMAGGFIALTPGWRIDSGRFGLAMPPLADGKIKAGTRLAGSFLITAPEAGLKLQNPAFTTNHMEWMRQLGFLGPPPYDLEISRGAVEHPSFPLRARPDNGILEGRVSKTADMFFSVPLEFTGLNPNRPAGIWREGAGISFTGVFEGRAWPRLDVGKAGRFVAGQLIGADNTNVAIEVVAWTADRLKLDINNPTDKPVKTTVRSAKLTGLKSFEKTVELPAGSSALVEAD